jgi:hypothetical protein
MEWVPTVSLDVVKVTIPLTSVALPSDVAPSMHFTVPVAVDGVTVAVKVTDWPELDGFKLGLRSVAVFALLTVWLITDDALVL